MEISEESVMFVFLLLGDSPPLTNALYHGKSGSGEEGSGRRGDLSKLPVSLFIKSLTISRVLEVVNPSLVASTTYSLPLTLKMTCSPSEMIRSPSALVVPTRLSLREMVVFNSFPMRTSEFPKFGFSSLPAKRAVPR